MKEERGEALEALDKRFETAVGGGISTSTPLRFNVQSVEEQERTKIDRSSLQQLYQV